MSLETASELAQEAEGSKPTAGDRRLRVRRVCDLLGSCKQAAADDSPAALASVLNISRGGVALQVSQPFETGSIVSLELPLAKGSLLACVVRTATKTDGWWDLVCTFVTPLNDDTLSASWKPTPDRRTRERFACDLKAMYYTVETGDRCCWLGTVKDISTCGVCLVVDRPLEVGTSLQLELYREGEAPELKTLACVVRVDAHGDRQWSCGCSFMWDFADQQLLELLSRSDDAGTPSSPGLDPA
jgi:PilZ domain